MNAIAAGNAVASTAYRTVLEPATESNAGIQVAAASAPASASFGGGAVQPQSLDFIGALAAAPQPIDARKVDAIRNLIASGAYPINAHAIAAKMIALDLH